MEAPLRYAGDFPLSIRTDLDLPRLPPPPLSAPAAVGELFMEIGASFNPLRRGWRVRSDVSELAVSISAGGCFVPFAPFADLSSFDGSTRLRSTILPVGSAAETDLFFIL